MGGAGGLIVHESRNGTDPINAEYTFQAHGGTSGDEWRTPVDEDAPF